MNVSLGLLYDLHNFRTAELQNGLFGCFMNPNWATRTEILTKTSILDRTFDELGQPEQTDTLGSSCERLTQWRIAARPAQVVDSFQHVPIKVGRLVVERTNLCKVDAVVTPRHLGND